jgi:hypothetical protein
MDHWFPIMCPDGPYELNVEGVTRLIRAFAYADGLWRYTSYGADFEVGPKSAPYMTMITDWPSVYRQRDTTMQQIGGDFYSRMSTNGMTGNAGIEYLESLVDQRRYLLDDLKRTQMDASKRALVAMNAAIDIGEAGLATSRFLLKASVETELILVAVAMAPAVAVTGGFISGTTAVGAAAASPGLAAMGVIAGSVGKGVLKWEDTDSIHKGLAEGAIELAFNALTIPVRAAMKVGLGANITMGLCFGYMKGVLKGAAGLMTYVNPADYAAELGVTGLANIPSVYANDLAKAIFSDPRLAIPAAVVLKLVLKAVTDSTAKALSNPKSGDPPTHRSPQAPEWPGVGRQAIHSTLSTCLLDCATPAEDYVTKYALRPAMSR